MRVFKVRILIEVLFLILAGSLFFLQVARGDYYYSLSSKNCVRLIPASGARGRILDNTGEVIVGNSLSYDVAIIFEEFRKDKRVLSRLSSILNITSSQIDKIIKKNLVSVFAPIIIRKDIGRSLAILIEENKFDLNGVLVQPAPKRDYPQGDLASHAIGYLSEIDSWRITNLKDYGYKKRDIVGWTGVEEIYNSRLRARDGGTQIQVNHRGKKNRVLGYKAPADGEDVRITVSIKMQKICEEELGDAVGAVVIISPQDGKVMTLVSRPSFSPAKFSDKNSNLDYFKNIFSDPRSPMFNRAISGSYPLGSVFKVVSAAAALDKGGLSAAQRRFFCTGKILVGAKEFKCMETHNSQNLSEALAHSCNAYFYRLPLSQAPEVLNEYALKFGLGKMSGIDLLGEARGGVPSPMNRRIRFGGWFDGDTANLGIGQGDLLASPIQAVRLIACFANGGKLVKPYLFESTSDLSRARSQSIDLGLNKNVLRIIRTALREAVSGPEGTAHLANLEDFPAAGKTGTAQVSGKPAHGWFVGFAPFDDPKIAFCVFLENAGSSAYSVMLARRILKRIREEKLI